MAKYEGGDMVPIILDWCLNMWVFGKRLSLIAACNEQVTICPRLGFLFCQVWIIVLAPATAWGCSENQKRHNKASSYMRVLKSAPMMKNKYSTIILMTRKIPTKIVLSPVLGHVIVSSAEC